MTSAATCSGSMDSCSRPPAWRSSASPKMFTWAISRSSPRWPSDSRGGNALAGLLHGVHVAVDLDEPHDVPRDALRQRDQAIFRPGFERKAQREFEDGRVGGGGGDAHGTRLTRQCYAATRPVRLFGQIV